MFIYDCKKCGKEIGIDITKVFIDIDGYALCADCSVGASSCSKEIRDLIEKDHLSLREYEINYIYLFSNLLEIKSLKSFVSDDYKISGFKEKQSPLIIGAMAKKFNYKYAHQFKFIKTLYFASNKEDGNLDMHAKFSDVINNCEYISCIGGFESNF